MQRNRVWTSCIKCRLELIGWGWRTEGDMSHLRSRRWRHPVAENSSGGEYRRRAWSQAPARGSVVIRHARHKVVTAANGLKRFKLGPRATSAAAVRSNRYTLDYTRNVCVRVLRWSALAIRERNVRTFAIVSRVCAKFHRRPPSRQVLSSIRIHEWIQRANLFPLRDPAARTNRGRLWQSVSHRCKFFFFPFTLSNSSLYQARSNISNLILDIRADQFLFFVCFSFFFPRDWGEDGFARNGGNYLRGDFGNFLANDDKW